MDDSDIIVVVKRFYNVRNGLKFVYEVRHHVTVLHSKEVRLLKAPKMAKKTNRRLITILQMFVTKQGFNMVIVNVSSVTSHSCLKAMFFLRCYCLLVSVGMLLSGRYSKLNDF